jgi:hypothetical protein
MYFVYGKRSMWVDIAERNLGEAAGRFGLGQEHLWTVLR